MRVKDFFKTQILKFKNRKKGIMIKKGTIVKQSFLEGKNLLRKNNFVENSEVGFGTYFGSDCIIKNSKVGKYCSIGSKLTIVSGKHPLDKNVSIHPAFYLKKNKELNKLLLSYVKNDKYEEEQLLDKKWNIIIGNDVWVGNDVKIMQGIKVGDGAVIGAGALVTKDVAPYTIVGGVPAKLIRKRFSDEDIDFLLKLKWWDKGEEWIKENAEYFEDIDILKSKSQK